MSRRSLDIAIIGAGIIGICAAAFLAEAGRKVTVIDRTGICEETSSGNAAALAFSDVLPLAHKGMMRNLPKWLADPLGPLAIPPAYLPKLLPWLVRFWRAGAASRYEASLSAQAGLMRLAETEWVGLMRRSETTQCCARTARSSSTRARPSSGLPCPAGRREAASASRYQHLQQRDLATYQPGLSPRFVRGTFAPGWKTVGDPRQLGKAVWRYAESKGASFVQGDVALALPRSDRITIQLKQGRTLRAQGW